MGFFVVNIREVFFYFVRKNRASQYVSVRVYFVAFKKFFFLVRVCVIVLRVLFSVRSLWHHIPVTRCECV